jgi:hypothetical protein
VNWVHFPLLRRELFYPRFFLNAIKLLYPCQPLLGLTLALVLTLALHRITELPPGVRHTAHMDQVALGHHPVIASVTIGLQVATKPRQ